MIIFVILPCVVRHIFARVAEFLDGCMFDIVSISWINSNANIHYVMFLLPCFKI